MSQASRVGFMFVYDERYFFQDIHYRNLSRRTYLNFSFPKALANLPSLHIIFTLGILARTLHILNGD
jgi:hypothetical protein